MMNLCRCSVVLALVLVRVSGPPSSSDGPRVHFRNVAQASGVRFVHHYSATPGRYFVESAPGGLAVFDYNGDGRPDIFFTNGADTPSLEKNTAAHANRLYRNDGQYALHGRDRRAPACGGSGMQWARQPRITTTTATSISSWRGSVRISYCATSATADSKTSPPRSGIASGDWAVAAGWFDYDNDGRLDLMVVNYVQVVCRKPIGTAAIRIVGLRIYCHPRAFQGLPNRLYRNRGDGTFEDVSARAGLARRTSARA